MFSLTRNFAVIAFTSWIYCIEDFFTFLWKIEFALKFSTVLNIFFTIQDFWATCDFPEKQSLPWKFSLFGVYFYIRGSFEQLALAMKNRVCPEFTVLNIYFLSFRIFEQLCLTWKTELPWNFHCIEIFFIIQDFWATCDCPENRVSLNSLYWMGLYIFYHSGFFRNLRLPWKRAALKIFTVLNIYILSFRIFEQLALAL